MKIGLFGINIGQENPAETMLPLARKAEAAGIESVWTGEHVLVPLDYHSRYPYNSSGKLGLTPEANFVDPLISLAHIAAQTSTLRLGTGINLLPQSKPLLLAKQVASLDLLSEGRLMLGLGVGWLAEEFQAMGTPFEKRGARFDDYLAAIKKVWSGEVVEHQSEFLSWSGFKSHPLPAQRPHPPIIIGGHSPAALRRAARHGDGWFGFAKDTEELAGLLGQLRESAEQAGRDPSSIEITALWRRPQEGREGLETYRELGVSRLLVTVHHLSQGDLDENLARLKEEVIEQAG
ncbi:MAG: LLM class F420-dependent oxidoreductase [SAR324 cluster bacterium]|nr:LLM class F420-dependent oxidoreductase [SAR324 cluster bacterium]